MQGVCLMFKGFRHERTQAVASSRRGNTPSPPTKSFPTKSPRVELSGRLPVKFNGHENSHPLEFRVCLSERKLSQALGLEVEFPDELL